MVCNARTPGLDSSKIAVTTARSEEIDLFSTLFLFSVYVLVALALGEDRAVDRSPDAKGKLQLAVFQ